MHFCRMFRSLTTLARTARMAAVSRAAPLTAFRQYAVDAKKGPAKGKIVSVVGAVVDVQFEGGRCCQLGCGSP